jgi:hypothetical protein
MSTPPHTPNDPPAENDKADIDRWYAALTSQPLANKPEAKQNQTTESTDVPVEIIKKVLRDNDKAEQEREAAETQRDWQRLQFRMRKESIQMPNQKPIKRDWLSPANRSLAMAAGVAAVMTVGLLVNGTGLDGGDTPKGPAGSGPTIDGTVMRGSKTEILRVKDPVEESRKLQSALQAVGTQADFRSNSDSIILDIVLTRPLKPAVSQALEKYNVPIPEQGNLSIQFIQ